MGSQRGKSGAYFARSIDQLLIVKELKTDEFDYFSTTLGAKYFEYFNSNKKTLLAKIFGIYQVTTRNGPMFVMVMENLNFNLKLVAQYDLKGSTKGRLAPSTAEVLLDEDFSNIMKFWPYEISPNSKTSFEVALRNDTEFLSSVRVMDYSLFIGVDQFSHELICVIDPESYKRRFMEFMQKEFQLDGK
ncbi:putative 1-phosphatidylinositol-3-phosphate 5-kinase FAB1D [Raphanus sativus]|uniref:1-phosphatidylinositol-3-phosphate 5-kinase FAB1D n=1 Tax=Raphanus sativus TaxID=3726 RepID=A0A6J0MP19_RAPSA|nr:putative 1-phosphatidylinositol-3-phosphate 5-kinase FAB1D [Raphanus sativus]